LSAAAGLLACAAMALPLNARHAPITAVKIVFVVNNVMASASQKAWMKAMKVNHVCALPCAHLKSSESEAAPSYSLGTAHGDDDRLIAAGEVRRHHRIYLIEPDEARCQPASTTGSQKEHSDVELFCGITPLCARPTTETLRGIYRGPGERRGAPRPAHAFEELLQGIAVARGTQEY
jgi:hypothetical protein